MALTRVSGRERHDFGEGYDVRGREVRTDVDDEKVGKVDDVLVDDNGSPRYLDVDLGFLKKHVLLPVGHARTSRDEDVVRVRGMVKEDFETIPEAIEGEVDRRYETRLAGAYDARLSGDRAYGRPMYIGWSDRSRTVTPPESVERVDQLQNVDVAEGQPDPRGWVVVTADGERVGRVDHLVGDTDAMKVRYLSVDVAGGSDRKVLIPTGYVDLDTDANEVRLNALESENVRRLPEYQGRFDREYAERLHTELDSFELGPRWYEHPRYSTTGLYGVGPDRL
ncbi:MAG: PRC-barrel domain-containing protein [Gemmatimonadetes bacterium]|nr:PRC-barrel domain-containing protein [Gemmatimonadota bacterium]